ncbi:HAD-IIIC family phosphatase [Plastoroseomonas hellenica]|uniref:HAD-IIIC family phosphatase n=1 Tax=Plastoroseomonas hellenica TaxID=2687306 RepID=UPI001BA79349|nr:HAD-IIIC family phosphatase [Plastoroseomonas hellenica]MBR0642201.1 HAD-IIIC family phosphatase [Plastoroseomonas hellenica]
MPEKRIRTLCVGDVLTPPLLRMSDRQLPEFAFSVEHADIDQHIQLLLSDATPDVLVSHATADFFFCRGDAAAAEAWAAQYCAAVDSFAARGTSAVILNTIAAPTERVVGSEHVALSRAVAAINEMLFACADRSSLVSLVDIPAILARVGLEKAINLQNHFVMRMPYTGHVLPEISRAYARAIRERFAPRKKLVVVDADNTLWGGIIGEDGVDGVEVGSQFPGVVHRKFQEQLLALRASGVLLGLVSKNNEADVREAFETLRMPLRWEHFTAARVNWVPKSQNIAAIAQELNLGVDSFVFIDDNSFELEEVRHALPSVDCYEFNARKPAEALSLLSRVKDLNTWSLTPEDLEKARQYAQEVERKTLQAATGSLRDYLRSLEIRIEVGRNRVSQLPRIAQLINKTNQFNLTTRRYSEAQLRDLMAAADVFDFRVIDRFGDMGIVGVVIVVGEEIDTFLMSCRALGRQVEGLMLKHVREAVARPLRASYIPTVKNGMVSEFYESNGLVFLGTEAGVKRYDFLAPREEEFFAAIHEVNHG